MIHRLDEIPHFFRVFACFMKCKGFSIYVRQLPKTVNFMQCKTHATLFRYDSLADAIFYK